MGSTLCPFCAERIAPGGEGVIQQEDWSYAHLECRLRSNREQLRRDDEP